MIGVIDVESTGLDETDQIVEIAVVRLDDDGCVIDEFVSLVRPTVPVGVLARAVHHITDSELADAPTLADVVLPPFDVVAGHQVAFDLRLMCQSGATIAFGKMIDTYRCARHLYPGSPGFSNQVLRYHLGVDVPRGMTPHRALPDARVTAAVLGRMLCEVPIDHLVHLTNTPVVLELVGFGKHRGRRWRDLDTDYLEWVARTDMESDIIHTARTILDERRTRKKALP